MRARAAAADDVEEVWRERTGNGVKSTSGDGARGGGESGRVGYMAGSGVVVVGGGGGRGGWVVQVGDASTGVLIWARVSLCPFLVATTLLKRQIEIRLHLAAIAGPSRIRRCHAKDRQHGAVPIRRTCLLSAPSMSLDAAEPRLLPDAAPAFEENRTAAENCLTTRPSATPRIPCLHDAGRNFCEIQLLLNCFRRLFLADLGPRRVCLLREIRSALNSCW